jgi:hypothetical protein
VTRPVVPYRNRLRRLLWSVVGATSCVAMTPVTAAAQGVSEAVCHARLRYAASNAAEACADREAFAQVVAARFGRRIFTTDARVTFDVHVDRDPIGLRASLVVTTPEGRDDRDHPEIRASGQCMALWEELARYIEYECLGPEPQPPSPPPPPPPLAPSAHWMLGGGLGAEFFGDRMTAAPAARVYLGRRWGSFSVRAELRGQWPVSVGIEVGTFRAGLFGGGLSGCWHWRVLGLCGVVHGLSLLHSEDASTPAGVFLGPRVEVDFVRWRGLRVGVSVEVLALTGDGTLYDKDNIPRWSLIGVLSGLGRIEWGSS